MAYTCPRDLDGFLSHLQKPDTRFRQQLGQDLITYLAEPHNSITCQDIGQFIDNLVPWTQSSNFKVASLGIEILTFLVDRLGTDFRPYVQVVLPAIIDRLGDTKDTVREKSQLLILKLLERNVITPNTLFEKISVGFTHKNAKIREEVLRCLINTVNEHGAHSLTLSKFIPDIVKLLSDPTPSVRDTAINTLVDLYKHVGEKLRADIQKRNLVPQTKWAALSAKFDEAKNGGELLPTASRSIEQNHDEVDRIARAPLPVKRSVVSSKSRTNQISSNVAGAMDEELFLRSFDVVPNLQIFSSRDVLDNLKSIQDTIADPSKDWNKRVESLKKIRSLVIAGAENFEEFYVGLKNLEFALQGSIKDLRSQVVRETCITIAYLSQTLGNKFDKMAEGLLQALINLIQNSAKIMATSGDVAVKFIIRHIYSSRLIPIITTNASTSKSKEIRRSCCEFIDIILTHWPTPPLERNVILLQDCIKKGIADADPEARVLSRKAFRGFKTHFPEHAEALVQSLEPSYRRVLQGDGMTTSTSSNNLISSLKTPRHYSKTSGVCSTSDSVNRKGFRSNSAIDLQAAQRAKARAQYSAIARSKIHTGTASLPRPEKTPDNVVTHSPERIGRTRRKGSQSQPTSRSGSPSSRIAYLYNRSTEQDSPRARKLSSGIPRSTTGSRDTSRETSPNRGSSLSRFRRTTERPPLSPASRPVLAQKILQQSREAESALADAFNESPENQFRTPRKSLKSTENHSDDSETSSICSERSYDSFRRTSDSYSWSGSQQRLTSRDLWEPCKDINEIIALCASNNWQERRDGLMSLHAYLSQEIRLSSVELKHLTEIFTKMFMDSHTKGWGVFLDALHEIIKIHKEDLDYWIYVLLQRVFLKIGGETLNSIQSKLANTLELIKISFPVQLLIVNVYRFLLDATQTPNIKSRIVVLNFLASLCNQPDAASAISSSPNSLQILKKLIVFSQDTKSMEIRHAAKVCIVALWNCDTPAVTLLLTELSKEEQDIASNVVHNHLRKCATSSEPSSPADLGSPKAIPIFGDQEEIYNSLRRTTTEIQNYSFETLGESRPKLERNRETTSQDSGISQMSMGNDVKHDVAFIEEKMEDLGLRPFNAISGIRLSNINGLLDNDSNGELKDTDFIIKEVLEKCCIDHMTPLPEKRRLLSHVLDLINQGHISGIISNSKKLLRIFIDHLAPRDSQTQVIVLKILAAMFQNPNMKDTWENFVELITLKILKVHSDEKREVVKEAEATAAAMTVFPFDTIVQTLAPLIRTSPYPEDLGAIKMLTKLIEANPHKITNEHLFHIMPGILKGTDHNESPVRKSSIFCMVALYKAVGEERFTPYINLLTGSKVKLLRLYISRSEKNNSSLPTSPKTSNTNYTEHKI